MAKPHTIPAGPVRQREAFDPIQMAEWHVSPSTAAPRRTRTNAHPSLTHVYESDRLLLMTKRLQVLFHDDELAEFQRIAGRRRLTTAAWVRESLRAARDAESRADPGPKLRAVREAVTHAYPVGDIDELLAEIERGYGDGPSR